MAPEKGQLLLSAVLQANFFDFDTLVKSWNPPGLSFP
jgi:hypothetical protein